MKELTLKEAVDGVISLIGDPEKWCQSAFREGDRICLAAAIGITYDIVAADATDAKISQNYTSIADTPLALALGGNVCNLNNVNTHEGLMKAIRRLAS
jgi:hypothetical protein